jgi:iron complex transport system ATP-binding protein
LAYSYSDGPVIDGVSVSLTPTGLTAVIGPNGSGKTTLLRLLSGVLPPSSGQVSLEGRPLPSMTRKEIAQRLAMVPQELTLPFPFTVRQLVELGRTPHLARGWWNGRDRGGLRAVEEALAATGTLSLGHRSVNELSGGERQRVVIAMALAQQPDYLLLDEPTTHLDIQHQLEILDLLVHLNKERGVAVLATMHDLNLAALYFDNLVLLNRGHVVVTGPPAQVLSENCLRQVFHTALRVATHPTANVPQVILVRPQ